MNGTTQPSRLNLSARRMALLATTIAGFGAAAFFAPYAVPKTDFFMGQAHAQNLRHHGTPGHAAPKVEHARRSVVLV